jgi:uncharacterized membrane protein YdjX (TVP38/TMEM64 family)
MRSNKKIEHFRARGVKPRAISDRPRIDPAFTNATVAENCHLTVWNPRLLHLRARGFARLHFRSENALAEATASRIPLHIRPLCNRVGFSRDNPAIRRHAAGMRRYLPLVALIVLAAAGYVLVRGVGWDTLARYQTVLSAWVAAHPIAAAGLYLLAYILTAALSLPPAAVLSVAGGLLFGAVIGCALTVTGATIGASILLVAVRSAFAPLLKRHRSRIPQQIQTRLARDGFNYLLALRLLPLFPFWIVNLAAAVVGIRLLVFVPATFLGIIPASFVFSSIGSGVGSVLAEGRTPDLSVLFSARILLPLAGLAVLSLLPALLRRRSGAHA